MRFWMLRDDACGTNWLYMQLEYSGRLTELAGVGLVTTDGKQDWYDNATSQYHDTLVDAKAIVEGVSTCLLGKQRPSKAEIGKGVEPMYVEFYDMADDRSMWIGPFVAVRVIYNELHVQETIDHELVLVATLEATDGKWDHDGMQYSDFIITGTEPGS